MKYRSNDVKQQKSTNQPEIRSTEKLIISRCTYRLRVRVMVFSAAFNNIAAVRSIDGWVHGENHPYVANHWHTLSRNVASSTPWAGFKLTTLVVIDNDGTYKYHTIYQNMWETHWFNILSVRLRPSTVNTIIIPRYII